jgi:hypothetical protein
MKGPEQKSVPTPCVDCTEQRRLNNAGNHGIPWKKWRPYLAERQWGTVRENYGQDGNAWDYLRNACSILPTGKLITAKSGSDVGDPGGSRWGRHYLLSLSGGSAN